MKVALIIPSYYPFIGGAEVFAQEVAEYMARKGAEVDIITLKSDQNLARFETINNTTVHRIGMGKIKYLSFLVAFFRLSRYMLKLNKVKDYDLIHSVGDGLPSHVGTIIKKFSKKPHLITIQGGSIAPGFRNAPSGKISKVLQMWSFKNADLTHVISRKLRRQVEELGAHNIVVIPNGVDSRIFKPMDKRELRKNLGFPQNDKIIIGIARLIPRKGIDHLIKATALVSEAFPNMRLIIIGDGEQRAELEKLIKELRLDDKVKILGFMPHDQIAQYLNTADVFVIPSLYEPLGIVTIEAMACGTPVIGSNIDGIRDVIENGSNGILVPPGDVKALTEVIEKLLQEENLKSRFIGEGLETVRKRFLWSSILRSIDELYTGLIQGNRGG